MIRQPVYRKHLAAVVSHDAGYVLVDFFLMTGGNKGLPAFNREDDG